MCLIPGPGSCKSNQTTYKYSVGEVPWRFPGELHRVSLRSEESASSFVVNHNLLSSLVYKLCTWHWSLWFRLHSLSMTLWKQKWRSCEPQLARAWEDTSSSSNAHATSSSQHRRSHVRLALTYFYFSIKRETARSLFCNVPLKHACEFTLTHLNLSSPKSFYEYI